MAGVDLNYRSLEDGLRTAGHYLDTHRRRLIVLLVIRNGLVLLVAPHDIHDANEAITFSSEELRLMTLQARVERGKGNAPRAIDPFFPTGYEDFLRALGGAAAQRGWIWLRLVRLGEMTLLRYGVQSDRREIIMTGQDIEGVLNYSFSLRRSATGGAH